MASFIRDGLPLSAAEWIDLMLDLMASFIRYEDEDYTPPYDDPKAVSDFAALVRLRNG